MNDYAASVVPAKSLRPLVETVHLGCSDDLLWTLPCCGFLAHCETHLLNCLQSCQYHHGCLPFLGPHLPSLYHSRLFGLDTVVDYRSMKLSAAVEVEAGI